MAELSDENAARGQPFVQQLARIAGITKPDVLADRLDVSHETVRGWWYGKKRPPGGRNLFKLLHLVGLVDENYKLDGFIAAYLSERASALDRGLSELNQFEARAHAVLEGSADKPSTRTRSRPA